MNKIRHPSFPFIVAGVFSITDEIEELFIGSQFVDDDGRDFLRLHTGRQTFFAELEGFVERAFLGKNVLPQRVFFVDQKKFVGRVFLPTGGDGDLKMGWTRLGHITGMDTGENSRNTDE